MANLELYRVFYTVAKCGSLTKAAEELYISQPAVSQSIKQLENQLGISLFNRTHRGMELSAQGGKLIFSKVEQALFLLEEAESMIEQLNTSATGTIRIGASDTIFEYFLAHAGRTQKQQVRHRLRQSSHRGGSRPQRIRQLYAPHRHIRHQ